MLRKNADAFVDKSLNTDVMLLFPPAHIALAALLHSANESKIDLGMSLIKSYGPSAEANYSLFYGVGGTAAQSRTARNRLQD